ncbi:TPA: peptide deformylase [Bacillus cereus]
MQKFHNENMITMKDFVPENHTLLRTKLNELNIPLTMEDITELEYMMEYLRNSQDPVVAKKYKLRPGSGLSANQIGLNKRMFVVLFEKGKSTEEYKLINPEIIGQSTKKIYLQEGERCLSVKGNKAGLVPRFETINVVAYNEFGEKVELTFKGYQSIIIQHEIDHLNGIMFYDHIDKKQSLKNLKSI